MEIPKPPQEIDLRNIIDKLAQFVARNGPEFEQMTKNKQKDNPKFSFLYGGEYYNYYQYKVSSEQSLLKQKGGRDQNNSPQVVPNANGTISQIMLNSNVPSSTESPSAMSIAAQWLAVTQVPTPGVTVESLSVHQAQLQDQIRQSEQNLAAQHAVMMQQQQGQIDDAIRKAQMDLLKINADEAGINFNDLDYILQPIIDSCTKDSISAGKAWILQHSASSAADYVLANYLLRKVVNPGATFTQKLHLIYLVNDVLHHCSRKNVGNLKKSLESVVVPMFCNASLGIAEDQQSKLNKLLHLWETKNNYFDPGIIDKMKNPSKSWSEYQSSLYNQFSSEVSVVTTATKQTYESYQSQHQAFAQHALQQIQSLEQQKQALELQTQQAQAQAAAAAVASSSPGGIESTIQKAILQQALQQQQQQESQLSPPPPPLPPHHHHHQPSLHHVQEEPIKERPISPLDNSVHEPLESEDSPPCFPANSISACLVSLNESEEELLDSQNHIEPPGTLEHYDGIGRMHGSDFSQPLFPPPSEVNFNQPPPGYMPINFPPGSEFPDLSKPPPGFPLPLINNQPPPDLMMDELLPSVPYFDLPAGLMVPLIKLEDGEYKPLDPSIIRLPPPAPPSERLLAAVEAFYAPPCHERTLDPDGWEKLGLYEYYRAKNAARKKKEDDIANGYRMKSKSPSPISRIRSKSKSPPKKRYRSKSRSRSRSRSKGRSRSRSRSKTPPRHYSSKRPMNNRRSPARRASRPYRPRSKSRSRSKSPPYSRQSLQKRSPERSPTPPSFLGSTYSKVEMQRQIDESNKGHQLLRKMGWSGAGLGVKEQGIEQPISGGEVRDRVDMYKGIGINLNDPYENFRKSKGQAFINRMKARAEERL